ncbi:hypothetical protein [Ornithinimicrobium panacihumi]|uniref:hypothetical protein n=1 Tax=Ornithinimicrobium panacihumi TaxID=2008449 RepID=UPI003F8B51AF
MSSSFERKIARSSLGTRNVTAARAAAPKGAAARAVERSATSGKFVTKATLRKSGEKS